MRSKLLATLTASVLFVGVSSCGSRGETFRTFPPAADLHAAPEPEYPAAALEAGPAGEAAERAWWNSVLLWGRENRDRVTRICKWSVDLGYKAPPGFCDSP
jgi:hypothetical protein